MKKNAGIKKYTAWAEVNLKVLADNYKLIKKAAGGKRVIPVVKANAYGHGITVVSAFFEEQLGVDYIAVARVSEAVSLREAGINKTGIIVLGGFVPGEEEEILKYRLEPSVSSVNAIKLLSKAAVKAGKNANVHIKINTGMNRLGARVSDAPALITEIKNSPRMVLKSVYTHFANADMAGDKFTQVQIQALLKIKPLVSGRVFFHSANSAGIAKYPQAHMDAVRPGIMLYGSYTDPEMKAKIKVKPVMTIKARVLHTATLKKGEAVSYGGLYKAKKNERIAIVGIGYGDGYRRDFTGKGYVIIKGKKCPVLGRVCMDLITVRATGNVKTGDEAIIFGGDETGFISVEELADMIGTISYELFTGIAERIPRIYKY
ncbi:MAG: alanine racemase [bacterium]